MKKDDKRLNLILELFKDVGIDLDDENSINEAKAVFKFARSRYLFCKDIKLSIYNIFISWISKFILLAIGYIMLMNSSDLIAFIKQCLANFFKIK